MNMKTLTCRGVHGGIKRYLASLVGAICVVAWGNCGLTDAADHSEKLILTAKPRIAIIIDDAGNHMLGTADILSLRRPITVAIMPFLTSSKEDAISAHKAGDEVILHLPMEPVRGKRSWLGPGAITTGMSDAQIKDQVRKDLDEIPYVVGLNNHMGSKASSDERVVRDIVSVAKERGIYIVDSATSMKSKMAAVSREMGVPCVKRRVFLDDVHKPDFVAKQVRQLVDDARETGWSIGIGHVGKFGPSTYQGIVRMLPYIDKEGVKMVRVSDIIGRESDM